MSKVTVQQLDGAFHVFQPSNNKRWIQFRVSAIGCEISEYEDIGNNEVKKYTLGHFKEYQWVKQDKSGIEPDVIKNETRKEAEEELDPFTKAELEARGEVEGINYGQSLKQQPKAPTDDTDLIMEQYNTLKERSDKRKPRGNCEYCNNEFIKGHPSKKFCNSKCKDRFHNKKKFEDNDFEPLEEHGEHPFLDKSENDHG